MATPTVPELMFGCWRRAWIEFADGTLDDTSIVVWLQTSSSMADVRVAADRPNLADRAGLHDCSVAELRAIARSDSSSGYTECGPVVAGADGLRSATASWHTRGHGVNFQPVSAFPEPGLMSWSENGTVMYERAPSGAYVEEWRLVPGSRDPLTVTGLGDDLFYRAGGIGMFVRDRRVPIPRPARLPELLDELDHDRATMEALLDCEFSVAERIGDEWMITTSTLPWREGKALDVEPC
ncbi:MAG: hypothetical protein M3P52_07735 [Actinomycetota bacterium]|nr:hypothetical protein [Actinomycetota bacterium]